MNTLAAEAPRRNRSSLPLDGIRVADFSWVLAGPHCTKWLAAMGAEVIKVESHFRPDRFRNVPPFIGRRESIDGSVAFNMLNYSKKDCTINLTSQEGRELARRLVRESDVMIENFSTGVVERLGLGYEELSRENPRLVMVSASGVGRTGPDAKMRAFGKSIHSFAGQTYLTRWPHTPPRGVGGTWTDPVTGVTAALAILAGLESAERTGRGMLFDLSMTEATIALLVEPFLEFLATGHEPEPAGNAGPLGSIHDTYRTRDTEWVAVATHSAAELDALGRLLSQRDFLCASTGGSDDGMPDVASVDGALRAFALEYARDEAVDLLTGAGVCAAPVLAFQDLPVSQQFRKRNLTVQLENEGVGSYMALRLPWQQYPQPNYQYWSAPKIGEHNRYVFGEILQLSPIEIERLTSDQVLM